MELYGKISDSTLNSLKKIANKTVISATGGASESESFASTLKASLAAADTGPQTTVEDAQQLAAQEAEPQPAVQDEPKMTLQDELQLVQQVSQPVVMPMTMRQDTMHLTPETADTPIQVEVDADGVELPTPGGPRLHTFIINGVLGKGYYGMDGYGNWGYYADQALTRKLPNGGWDTYRTSDGGPAVFEYDNAGRLTPSVRRDESRAGQIVTFATGNKAFEVEYTDLGYVKSIRPVTVDVSELRVAQTDPERDRGVSGRELLWHTEGVKFDDDVGETVDTTGFRPGMRRDWEEIMDERGYTAAAAAVVQPEPASTAADGDDEGIEPLAGVEAAAKPSAVGVDGQSAATEETTAKTAPTETEITAGQPVAEQPETTAQQETAAEQQEPTDTSLTDSDSGSVPEAGVEAAPVEQSADTTGGESAAAEETTMETTPEGSSSGGSAGYTIPTTGAGIRAADALFNALDDEEDDE